MGKRGWQRQVREIQREALASTSSYDKYVGLMSVAVMCHLFPKGDFSEARVKAVQRGQLRRDEDFVRALYRGQREIRHTYESLCDLPIFVRSFPYRGTRVSQSRHLMHCVNSYFHETYILQARLLSYSKQIERKYRRREDIDVSKIDAALRDGVDKLLSESTSRRSYHVHYGRLYVDDYEPLSTMELLLMMAGPSANELKGEYEKQARAARRKWARQLDIAVKSMMPLLDLYFGTLAKVVFDDKGNIAFPPTTKRR